MSHSDIGICNVALALIGQDSIRDFNENNKRGRLCQVLYYVIRDYLLAKFDWTFARKTEKLQQVNGIEWVPSGQYVFALPSDCKAPRNILPEGTEDWWEVQGQYLYAKREDVYLRYTKLETNPSKFTDTFAMLLATHLAYRIAPSLTQDKALTGQLLDQYRVLMGECWESDANIGNNYRPEDENPDNDTFVYPPGTETPVSSRYMPTED